MTGTTRIVAWVVLAVGIVSSALLVVRSTHELRVLHHEMQAVRKAHDEQLTQQSRLLLERSAKAALPGVEQVAVEQLEMEFPAEIARISQ